MPDAPEQSLLRKIENLQDLRPEDLDQQDVAKAKQEVLGLAADPEVTTRLTALREKVRAYRDQKREQLEQENGSHAKVVLEEIEQAIDQVQTQPPLTVKEAATVGTFQGIGLRMKAAFEKLFKGDFEGFGETLVRGLPLFALRLLGKIPLIGDSLKLYIAQAEGIDTARRALSPSELLTTDRDDALLKELQGQYDGKPEEFRKGMTFEAFLGARARAARNAGSVRGYTMLDLVNARTDSELSAETDARSKKVEAKGKESEVRKKETEKAEFKRLAVLAKENPEVDKALHAYALVDALQEVARVSLDLPVNAIEERRKDLSGTRPAGEQYFYVTVMQKFKAFMQSDDAPGRLGLKLSESILEDTHENNSWYHLNLNNNFNADDPITAINQLRGIQVKDGEWVGSGTFDEWDLNVRSAEVLPKLQKAIESHLQTIREDFAPKAPEPAEKPAEPAPADTAAATPAKPSEAPADKTA